MRLRHSRTILHSVSSSTAFDRLVRAHDHPPMGATRRNPLPAHHFTLIVDGVDLQHESVVDSLFDAGCDDALVSSADGIQFIDFDREAANLDDALLSAVADMEQVQVSKSSASAATNRRQGTRHPRAQRRLAHATASRTSSPVMSSSATIGSPCPPGCTGVRRSFRLPCSRRSSSPRETARTPRRAASCFVLVTHASTRFVQ